MQRGPSRGESRDGHPPSKGQTGSQDEASEGRKPPAPRKYRAIWMLKDGAEICEMKNRLAELAPRLPEGLEGPLCRQRLELQRLDFSELESAWEALEEAREHDIQNTEKTTVTVPPDDPDFSRVQQMEAELEWYMTQGIRLHHLCEAYRSEAETWRKKTEMLTKEKSHLAGKTFIVRRENELIEAAADDLDPSADLGAVTFLRRRDSEQRRPTPRQRLPPAGPGGRQALAAGKAGRQAQGIEELTLLPGRLGELAAPPPAVASARAPCPAPGAAGAREREYLEEIARLEEKLRRARQRGKQQRALHRGASQLNSGHKDDMEHFFLLCMHDLQKEVQRRRSTAAAQLCSPRVRSLGGRNSARRTGQREQVLDMLVNSDRLLNLLYERLFPHRLGASRASAEDVSASMASWSASWGCSVATAGSALLRDWSAAIPPAR